MVNEIASDDTEDCELCTPDIDFEGYVVPKAEYVIETKHVDKKLVCQNCVDSLGYELENLDVTDISDYDSG